jgi:hypothetical protein
LQRAQRKALPEALSETDQRGVDGEPENRDLKNTNAREPVGEDADEPF